MTTHTDILIGRIALERGLVTRDQLADCLKEQAEASPAAAPTLGAILLRRGLIARADLDGLIEEQKRRLGESIELTDAKLEDTILGRLLVRQGLVTEKQVYECLRAQAELAERGQGAPRLGELLVRKGFLATDAVAATLDLHSRAYFICPECSARYSVLALDPGRKYECRKCGANLAREDKPPDEQLLPASRGARPEDVVAASAHPQNRYAGGRYLLIKEIGRGGMGVVWKAWQNDLERYVAIKQMSDRLWGESELKRFLREAQTAASLSHPNIATIYEAGAHEGKHFIAMEYVEGEALNSFAFGASHGSRQGTARYVRALQLPIALQIVRDAALAVDHAHSKGVIHRDIKPHNIMVARSGGRVYVMDFGLAKPVRNRDGISMGDTILGTPSYMSPEQARGETVDRRSDVYSLGAVLYFVLTGHAPFSGQSAGDTLMKVLTDDPVPPRQLNPALPADLELIAMKCLAKDRRRRYDSARALADDLTRHLQGEPVRARRMSLLERAARGVRNRPVFFSAAAIAVVALALVVSAFKVALRRDDLEIASYLKQAGDLAQRGDHQGALVHYEKALVLDRWNDEALAGRKRADQALRAAAAATIAREQTSDMRRLADQLFESRQFAAAQPLYERLGSADRIRECQEALAREQAAAAENERAAREAREKAERSAREERTRAMTSYANARTIVDASERLKLRPNTVEDVRRRLQEAQQLLGQALEDDATYVEALHLRGQVRVRLGDLSGAAEDFAAAMKREPAFGPAAFGATITQLIRYVQLTHSPYLTLHEQSLAALDELGRAADHSARTSGDPLERWASKAIVLMRARNFAKASAELGVVSQEGRGQRSYHFTAAVLRVEEKEPDDAIRELTSLLEFDPMAPEALFLRSVLQTRTDDPSFGRADADRLIAILPDSPYGYLARALANEVLKQPADAARDLEKAASLDPRLAPVLKAERERLQKP